LLFSPSLTFFSSGSAFSSPPTFNPELPWVLAFPVKTKIGADVPSPFPRVQILYGYGHAFLPLLHRFGLCKVSGTTLKPPFPLRIGVKRFSSPFFIPLTERILRFLLFSLPYFPRGVVLFSFPLLKCPVRASFPLHAEDISIIFLGWREVHSCFFTWGLSSLFFGNSSPPVGFPPHIADTFS